MSTEPLPLLRPVPRRPHELNLASSTSNVTSRPSLESKVAHSDAVNSGTTTPAYTKTRSFLNLTSSTLFGIYSPTAFSGEHDESPIPQRRDVSQVQDTNPSQFATRTHAPTATRSRSVSTADQTPLPDYLFRLISRTLLLFVLGMGYGLLITHLHDDRHLADIKIDGFIKPRYNRSYLCFWGTAGVGLGSLLPYIDTLFPARTDKASSENKNMPRRAGDDAVEDGGDATGVVGLTADWNPVVRSIGAFVGIAFAIRKLPWTSPLQISATLALVNPVLWYLVDRSKPGFFLSSSVGLFGTIILLSLNPEVMPAPQSRLSSQLFTSHGMAPMNGLEALGGLISRETLECGTWIISVLFCSCVCFGNIGRRLALPGVSKIRRGSFH